MLSQRKDVYRGITYDLALVIRMHFLYYRSSSFSTCKIYYYRKETSRVVETCFRPPVGLFDGVRAILPVSCTSDPRGKQLSEHPSECRRICGLEPCTKAQYTRIIQGFPREVSSQLLRGLGREQDEDNGSKATCRRTKFAG